MVNRREFFGAIGKPAAAVLAVAVIDPLKMTHALEVLANHKGTPDDIAMDESFWFEVQKGFTVDRSIINLNNSPEPRDRPRPGARRPTRAHAPRGRRRSFPPFRPRAGPRRADS